jgi:vacuolar-type H+-ATPase subunit H
MNYQEAINEIVSFLLYPEIKGWLLIFKYSFLAFGFFFLGYTLWGALKTSFLKRAIWIDLKEFLTYKPFYVKKFLPKWKKIEKRLESKIEADFKLAILEADDLLNKAMDEAGYKGKDLSEKLEKVSEEIISNLKELKEARKVREDIISDPTYRLSEEEAKKILKVYEKALKDLQAL